MAILLLYLAILYCALAAHDSNEHSSAFSLDFALAKPDSKLKPDLIHRKEKFVLGLASHAVDDVKNLKSKVTHSNATPSPAPRNIPHTSDLTIPPSAAGFTGSPTFHGATVPPSASGTLPPNAPSLTLSPSVAGFTIPPSASSSSAPNLSSYPFSLPTRVPTVKTPTAAPSHSENYMMMVTQGLIGIGASDFNDVSVNAEVFQAAVAGCFEGIASTDVSITSCTDTFAGSSSDEPLHLRRHIVNNLTKIVSVDYMIYYNIAARGFSGDPEGAYEDMLTQLQDAVNGTVFNTQLADNTALFNATDLSGVRTGPITNSSYAAVAGDDDDGGSSSGTNSNGLSKKDKLIIGLTVGIGGFLLLVLLISAWWYMAKKNNEEVIV